jgi:hypothetical protein
VEAPWAPPAPAADNAQNFARLRTMAKEIRWTNRPFKDDLKRLSELLDPAETLLGVVRILITSPTRTLIARTAGRRGR